MWCQRRITPAHELAAFFFTPSAAWLGAADVDYSPPQKEGPRLTTIDHRIDHRDVVKLKLVVTSRRPEDKDMHDRQCHERWGFSGQARYLV